MKKKIKRSVKSFKKYIITNILFLGFILTSIINSTILRSITTGSIGNIKPVLADLAIILVIGSIGYLMKPKKKFNYFLIMTIITTALCVINSMYNTYYKSFASISLIPTSFLVTDMDGGSDMAVQVINLNDFLYIWAPIVLILVNRRYKKKYRKLNAENKKTMKEKIQTVNILVFSSILTIIFLAAITTVEMNRFKKAWNREFIISNFGLYTYQINDIMNNITLNFDIETKYDIAKKEVEDFYNNKEDLKIYNEYTDIFKGQNIIMIHAESIQSFVMDLKFNGEEVTPILNKLSKEGIYCSNFYSQSGVGTSSDAEFTLNTSLMPSINGTVFVDYFDREFVTIPKILKEQGYYSFSMHGNEGDFWNRNIMHENMGYNIFYSQDSYVTDEVIGMGISDMSFFRQSAEKIENEINNGNAPFYSTALMLSNHLPFSALDKYGDFPVDMKIEDENGVKSIKYMEDTVLGNYFKSVHYADAAIGYFIEELDKKGILDNTVIVIYGDHDARLDISEYEYMKNYDFDLEDVLDKNDERYTEIDYYTYELNREVPFIIYSKNSDMKEEITTVMGMYDILPTLGNMFGFDNKYSLGHDIMNLEDNIVPFVNGNFITNNIYYNSQKDEYITFNNEPIAKDYIMEKYEYVKKLLQISNNIIVYDLLKDIN